MNIFDFDYEIEILKNKDNSDSRFSVVRGDKGFIVHTKKDSYTMVKTADLSMLGDTFTEKGYKVNSFHHRNGEVIGLNINYQKNKLTSVGDKNYGAIITVPNNGSGSGYLSIQETRLICTNGMSRSSNVGDIKLKIPHTTDYPTYLKVMEDAIIAFEDIIMSIEVTDTKLNEQKLDDLKARYELNKWFFNNEIPLNEKTTIGSLDNFRKMLAVNPEEINCIERYNQLMSAYTKELEHNITLNLDLSMYTVLAACTNYLSRRIENSKSVAPKEIKFQRESKKLESLILI